MDREARRSAILARIPASYSPVRHVVVPAAFGLAVLLAAVAGVSEVRAWELAVAPLTFVAGLGFEWRLHKTVLHQRRRGLGELYVRHELSHHVVFVDDDMTVRSRREWGLVLMPTFAIVAAFALVVPFALALWQLGSANAALVFVATAMCFFLFYEWMHLAYHLSPTSPIGRLRPVRVLRELHRRHHDPSNMKRWNFNVTIPLFDWLHGTLWSEAAADAAGARRRERVAARGEGASVQEPVRDRVRS
jgi:sterol desaturase/sphingolipid hydroxylase (fatty acid hydroxylase superfamily)